MRFPVSAPRPGSVPAGGREVGAEDGVSLIEDEQHPVPAGHIEELVEWGHVPILENTESVTTIVGVAASIGPVPAESSSSRWSMSRCRYTVSAERESRHPSMMLA